MRCFSLNVLLRFREAGMRRERLEEDTNRAQRFQSSLKL